MNNILLGQTVSKEIYNFCQYFTEHLSKPQQGNFRELVRGMLSTGSVHLQTIAKSSGGGNALRKDVERLSRTLASIPADEFTALHIQRQATHFKNEPVLLLSDGGDIQKPYAKKMEGVCGVVNGSDSHKAGRGYPLHGIVAYGLHTKQSIPLSLHLFSTQSDEYKSDWDEQKKVFRVLNPLINDTTHDRIVVEDRGCDDEKRFIHFRKNMECSFVTRLCGGTRARRIITVDEDGKETKESVTTLAHRLTPKAGYERSWLNKKVKKTLVSKIIWHKVFLPDHQDMPLFLIAVFSEGYDEPMLVLTDLYTGDADTAWKHFFYYKKRWEVENFFRAIKQNFSAEQFLVLKLKKIQALAFLLMLVMSFLHSFLEKIKTMTQTFTLIFMQFCKKEQRTSTHPLDLCAFLQTFLTPPDGKYSYRFFSRFITKNRSQSNKNQPSLFQHTKKW